MTQPTTTAQTADGGDESVADAGLTTRRLAAIQHRYEEARASIVDPARAPSDRAADDAAADDAAADDAAADDAEVHPATEQIDVEAVPPRVPRNVPPPGPVPTEPAVIPGPRRWWQAVRAALHGGRPADRPAP